MIESSRFVARHDSDLDGWLRAHRSGVSATMAAKASTPSGFKQFQADDGFSGSPPDEYMEFGALTEPDIAAFAHRNFGILPNDWLIRGKDVRLLATPDGLSPDHTRIGEYKTTGDPWDGAEENQSKIPIVYRRQVQFQLMVTGAQSCLFAWMLRAVDDDGYFYAPWMEPRYTWILPDAKMQDDLYKTARKILKMQEF